MEEQVALFMSITSCNAQLSHFYLDAAAGDLESGRSSLNSNSRRANQLTLPAQPYQPISRETTEVVMTNSR